MARMIGAGTTRSRIRGLVSLVIGALVLAATVATVGGAPFLRALHAIDPVDVTAALLLGAAATAAAAWRWRTVAAGVGVPLEWTTAASEYYRSQFVNSVLPGGVLGDVDRVYRHATASARGGDAARAVVLERSAGQIVQLAVTAIALSVLGAASSLPDLGWAVGGFVALAVLAVAAVCTRAGGRRMLRRELGVMAQVFGAPRAGLRIAVASVVVFAAHVATFVIAGIAVGVHGDARELIALALVALTAGAIPVNVGGWGPREASAVLFASSLGLGGGTGAAASAAFGALGLVAVLPGAVISLSVRASSARHTLSGGGSGRSLQRKELA
ncbi:lysylphosphatidylglycerol synthase transmembrane domain-containing protein [Gryllotalpicola reticulitermitis]|uniref:Lysylphosphatidylglycerol synthase transmembrane domain-containing protein n=1 Tax=Gryllotalpicola reticulitermitis TaxID=1184153 RepID=A0ABV8QAJ0_9MICO